MITYFIILAQSEGNGLNVGEITGIIVLSIMILTGVGTYVHKSTKFRTFVKTTLGFMDKTLKKIENRVDEFTEKIPRIEREIDSLKTVLEPIHDINMTVEGLTRKIDKLNESDYVGGKSPMILNPKGEKVLKESGISYFVEEHYDEILNLVKAGNTSNAYKAEGTIINILKSYKNRDEYIGELETRAFKSGTDVSTLLFVAAIHIRDKIFKSLNLEVVDIDKDKQKKNHNRA
ncbi:hypothetical protein ES705_25666 [subsurface metagenome]